MSEELKPCPFCGGEASLFTAEEVGYIGDEHFAVKCNGCFCGTGHYADPGRAAEAWNRRPQQPNEALTVDELWRMDGQPVWVKSVDPNDSDTNYWAIVSANMHYSHKSGGVISTSTDGVAVVAIAYFENYGKTWVAYRHKPEPLKEEMPWQMN